MRSRVWRARVLVPVVLLVAFLVFFEPDRAIFTVFLALVGFCSMLAGRDLASAMPPKVSVAASLLVWIGIAVLYGRGVVHRDPGFSQYLVYLGLLSVGMFIPLSVLIETWRKWRHPPE